MENFDYQVNSLDSTQKGRNGVYGRQHCLTLKKAAAGGEGRLLVFGGSFGLLQNSLWEKVTGTRVRD